MKILGISAFYHDSSAAILVDGKIIGAAQEERFTRNKHDAAFPKHSIEYCLNEANLKLSDLDYVIFHEKPFLKFERILETHLSFAPRGFGSFRKAMPVWLSEKLFQKRNIIKALNGICSGFRQENLLFSEHHISHAASAFYPSPYDEAVILTMDGVGEWATASVAIGNGSDLKVVKEMSFPHSLGLLYSAFTYYTGFKVNSGEYKLMGLAPYGAPKYANKIMSNIIDIKSDGSFSLDQSYFNYCTGLTMTNSKFSNLFDNPVRKPESPLTQFHMDIAASIQVVTEKVMLLICRALYKQYSIKNLCLAGGVALNCVANGKLLEKSGFENIWIQPASGDAGTALGAAYIAHYTCSGQVRKTDNLHDQMQGGYFGPCFATKEVEAILNNLGANFHTYTTDTLVGKVAKLLAEGKAIGWMNGRMEFGPRALGARSILADPRSDKVQKQLNLKVKYRESFRPFAPSVLSEDLSEWFDLPTKSPYMLLVSKVRKSKQYEISSEENEKFGIDKLNVVRSKIPAVTHVDYTSRIQTVHKETNPMYYKLISEFKSITGCGVLVNTSFNIRGEPIVCSPKDAFHCFMGTDLDVLVIENCILYKSEQSEFLKQDYRQIFDLD